MKSLIQGLRPRRSRASCALLCLAALALAGCGGRGGAPAADEGASASMTVTVAKPSRQSISREVVASGSVEAWQEMSLGVELSGVRVSQVLVEVGVEVKAGQPLVLLDRRTLEVQARQAEASLAQARASLEVARAGATRGDSLLAQKLISTSDYDDLRAALIKAEAQLASAEAELESTRLRLGFATLRAPDSGIISSRTVQPGQIAQVGTEMLRLIRRGRLEWRAEVSEGDLVRISPGALVRVTGPGGEVVEGRIRAVSPGLDSKTRTALVYADLPKPGALRAGMFAEGRVRTGAAEAMVVPRQAIVFRDGFPYVFVLGKDSKVAQRRVEAGPAQGEVIEVRSGLAATDQVVVRGAGFLGDGDLVKVVAGG
ncbi:MAG: efflux RND transporter periplasmic adaptor subunit [Steroidobacteraceae bacterium]|jgi:RND family efflux transporter MFP subunit|nr:efflux RND transporter periplasmic adaptor subunit [Steroidobacteraceae bacterium]